MFNNQNQKIMNALNNSTEFINLARNMSAMVVNAAYEARKLIYALIEEAGEALDLHPEIGKRVWIGEEMYVSRICLNGKHVGIIEAYSEEDGSRSELCINDLDPMAVVGLAVDIVNLLS